MRPAQIAIAMSLGAYIALATLAAADELEEAMHCADCLSFFRSLEVETSQLQRMIPPLQRIQQYITQGHAARDAKLAQLSADYSRARALLIAGQQLPDDLRAKLEGAKQEMDLADLKMKQSISQQMSALSKIFSPVQNQRLDWTPPAELQPAETARQRAQRRREQLALISDAGRLQNRLRYMNAFDYSSYRVTIISEYLDRYFERNTAQFEQAHAIVMELIGEVRLVDEAAWPQQANLYAERQVIMLGLMPEEAQPGAGARGRSCARDCNG